MNSNTFTILEIVSTKKVTYSFYGHIEFICDSVHTPTR